MATAHTSRESLGVGVLAVPFRATWGSEEASVVLVGTEDLVTVKCHVLEGFAWGKLVEGARQTWSVHVGVTYGMAVLSGMREAHMDLGHGLRGVSDVTRVNMPGRWRWNPARKRGMRRMTGQVSAPVVKNNIRPRLCETRTHIESICVRVYSHAVHD